MSKYCGECNHLSITEELQKDKSERHWCKLFDDQVFHLDEHPLLPRLIECLEKGKELIQSESVLNIYNCHACVFLNGIITEDGIGAQCGDGVWKGERYISSGNDIVRPSKCIRKILRRDEPKKPNQLLSFWK